MRFPYIVLLLLLTSFSACNTDKKQENHPRIAEKEAQLFELLPGSETGITFNNHIEEGFEHFFAIFQYTYNGGGVAIGDINNDGLSDIYFTGNHVPNTLYLNKGDLTFEDITASAGVSGGDGWHSGVVMADVNSDGFMDIYICRGGFHDDEKVRANLLYINKGDNTFVEEAAKYGLDDKGFSIMASFFDADNDNDLDLYITNRPDSYFLNYKKVLEGKAKQEDDYRDKLYINTNGKYVEKGIQSGIKNSFEYGLSVVTADFNDDNRTDIHVANDYLGKDFMYINQGKGMFKDEITSRFKHIPFYAMGVDVVDFNNDGLEDIMQLEMLPEDYERSKTNMASMNVQLFRDLTTNGFYYQNMHNQLQLNRGKGIFSDISQYAGLAKTDWSWACLGSDFDNDGFRDLYVTNGYRRDVWNKDTNAKLERYMRSPEARSKTVSEKANKIIKMFKENKIPNYIFKNNGDLTFSKKITEWGMGQNSFSNGAATADFDNDGDLDIVVNNIDDMAFVYKNTSEKLGNRYLKIKLEGPKGNPTGLGAKVTINYNGKQQYHEFKTVRGYLSSVEPLVHFGLGKTAKIDTLQVIWNDGKKNILLDVNADQLVTVPYGTAEIAKETIAPKSQIFSEVTRTTFSKPFLHQENEYDDFKDQILLPHKLSQNGPCITVADINGDGLEDFFVGGASEQSAEIYTQNTNGKFNVKSQSQFKLDAAHEDVGAVFFDADGDTYLDLYVVSGGYEYDEGFSTLQDRLYLNDGKGNFSKSDGLPEMLESGSCVVPLDFDGDGDLDLFVGGRLVPKKYPTPPKSFLLINDGGKFSDVTEAMAPELSQLGMVTSAVWSDVDGDNSNELIVVGEWMPISLFKKDDGKFKNVTADYGLTETGGWWNKIVASDIDKDGDIDFIVGNLGLNYKFSASVEHPFLVYADDFDNNGTNDVFLAKEYKNRKVPVRGWQCTSEQMPGIARKFNSYTEFAKADIEQVVGKNLDEGVAYQAHEFASVILENNNGTLKLKRLPAEAQFSVINGIVVDDFNQDGIQDLAIAGNKFEVEVETTPADASIGSILLGTTSGGFKPVNYLDSGFFLPENVKNIQRISMENGKTGILAAINDGPLKLFIDQ